MSDAELKKYAELLISMSTDFLAGGITSGTFQNNLRMIAENIAAAQKTP